MSVYEWIIMFCMLSIAVCAIVFPTIAIAQRKHHHKQWMQLIKDIQETKHTEKEENNEQK